jgi:hypothetical protein
MDQSLTVLHDKLLAEKPEGVEHDETSCPICSSDENAEEHMSDNTFTEEEVRAKVAEATKSLEDRIVELEAANKDASVLEKIKEATDPLHVRVAELEAELDKATLRAEQAEAEIATAKEFWENLETEEAAEAERAARKAERVEKVKEVVQFSDEYIGQRADGWAELSDEDFAAALEDWKAIASAPPVKKEKQEIEGTFLSASTVKDGSENDVFSALRTLRRKGVDPRQIR